MNANLKHRALSPLQRATVETDWASLSKEISYSTESRLLRAREQHESLKARVRTLIGNPHDSSNDEATREKQPKTPPNQGKTHMSPLKVSCTAANERLHKPARMPSTANEFHSSSTPCCNNNDTELYTAHSRLPKPLSPQPTPTVRLNAVSMKEKDMIINRLLHQLDSYKAHSNRLVTSTQNITRKFALAHGEETERYQLYIEELRQHLNRVATSNPKIQELEMENYTLWRELEKERKNLLFSVRQLHKSQQRERKLKQELESIKEKHQYRLVSQ